MTDVVKRNWTSPAPPKAIWQWPALCRRRVECGGSLGSNRKMWSSMNMEDLSSFVLCEYPRAAPSIEMSVIWSRGFCGEPMGDARNKAAGLPVQSTLFGRPLNSA